MRQSLIQNDTLSHLALHLGLHLDLHLGLHLGLHHRLRLSSELSANAEMPSQGMASDAFEAYVGALWTEHADRSKAVRDWLETLWSPKVFPTLKDVGICEECGS